MSTITRRTYSLFDALKRITDGTSESMQYDTDDGPIAVRTCADGASVVFKRIVHTPGDEFPHEVDDRGPLPSSGWYDPAEPPCFDVIEAARRMRAGKVVRRDAWGEELMVHCTHSGVLECAYGETCELTVDDLLGTDWYEVQS